MKKYISAALSITTIGLLFYTLIDLKEQVKQIPVLKNQLDSVMVIKDSLVTEVFIHQTRIGKYETTVDYLLKTRPNAGLAFINHMGYETE
jgi:hypothetical protein